MSPIWQCNHVHPRACQHTAPSEVGLRWWRRQKNSASCWQTPPTPSTRTLGDRRDIPSPTFSASYPDAASASRLPSRISITCTKRFHPQRREHKHTCRAEMSDDAKGKAEVIDWVSAGSHTKTAATNAQTASARIASARVPCASRSLLQQRSLTAASTRQPTLRRVRAHGRRSGCCKLAGELQPRCAA